MRSLMISGPRRLQLRCSVPERPPERVRGLLRRNAIKIDEALLIPDTTSVHTFGMRFPILVARLDDSLRVVDVRRVMPYRLVIPTRNARHVLECHPDVDLRPGDILRVDGEQKLRARGSAVAILPRLPPGRGRGRARCARAPIV